MRLILSRYMRSMGTPRITGRNVSLPGAFQYDIDNVPCSILIPEELARRGERRVLAMMKRERGGDGGGKRSGYNRRHDISSKNFGIFREGISHCWALCTTEYSAKAKRGKQGLVRLINMLHYGLERMYRTSVGHRQYWTRRLADRNSARLRQCAHTITGQGYSDTQRLHHFLLVTTTKGLCRKWRPKRR